MTSKFCNHMGYSKIAFSQQKLAFPYDFSVQPLTSEGGLWLVAKQWKRLERTSFSGEQVVDRRDARHVACAGEQLLSSRLLPQYFTATRWSI